MLVEVMGKGEWASVKKKWYTTVSPWRHPCKQITVHLYISKTPVGRDPGIHISKLN